jgi:hypothetical protein
MIKKMKCLILTALLVFGASTFSIAQDDSSSYSMWESIMLTPDNTKLKVLGDNMRAHNQKYHAKGSAHEAVVYNITTGPNSGKLLWEMGPITFSDLDARPAEGGHDEDWRDNIMPYIKKMNTAEYWKQMDDLSNVGTLDDDNSKYPILYVRYFEVARDHGYTIPHLLKQMSDAVKGMDGDNPWGLYDNQFRQGYDIGRHIAWVSFLKNWAEFDEDNNFKDAFLKANGDKSWDAYLKGLDDTFSNSWDEVWVYNKELSGH